MSTSRGATTAEKLRGQGLGLNTGALAPHARQRPGWVLGAGGGRRCEGPGVLPPENF